MKYNEVVSLYDRDVAVLKDYVIKKKLSLHRSMRKTGFDIEIKKREKGTVNEEKLDVNIIRAKSAIFELAYCNLWDFFFTFTLDPNKYDRSDLGKWHKDFTQWIRDYNKKHSLSIKFLLIPERHKDGSWHMHGLITGLPLEHLIKNQNGYLDWLPYREKFGYCSVDHIKNHEAVSKYITKYISKNLQDCIKDINAHMYYCSRGLRRSQIMKKGTLSAISIPWDYEGEYCKVKWFDQGDDRCLSLID